MSNVNEFIGMSQRASRICGGISANDFVGQIPKTVLFFCSSIEVQIFRFKKNVGIEMMTNDK